MYSINDVLIYTTYGLCQVKDIVVENLLGTEREYYVLVSLTNSKSETRIPTDNLIIQSRLHPLLDKDVIIDIINEIPFIDVFWIDDNKKRTATFSEIVKKGDRKELVKLIKSIKYHQNEIKGTGKKLHAVDESAMKDALKLIIDEFAYVLKKDKVELNNELNILFEKNREAL